MAGKWLANLSVLLLTSCSSSLHVGDLLFHVTKTGNAITDVTPGMIDHVAIVISKDRLHPIGNSSIRSTAWRFLRVGRAAIQVSCRSGMKYA